MKIPKRLEETKFAFDSFLQGKRHFPAKFSGGSGCGKTKFVKDYLDFMNLSYVFCTVPDEGEYLKHVESQVIAYQSAIQDAIDMSEFLRNEDKCAKENSAKRDEMEKLKKSIPYVVIDEAHQLGLKSTEIFQHEKTFFTIGEVKIPYDRLIFISHTSLGKNNSENTRLTNIEVPDPTREDILSVLVEDLKFSKVQAKWAVTHSKANFRSVLDTITAYNTPLQSTYRPRGLSRASIEVLWFYFRTDASNKCSSIPDSEKLAIGTNSIGNCSAFLGLDHDAIKTCENDLKEENFISTGSQSKRVIVKNETSHKTVLAILKLSGYFDKKDLQKETTNPETEQPTPPTSKPTSKPTAKTPTSKLDKVRPDKTPAQIQAEIRAELDSKKVPSYYDDMSTEDLTSAI